jgi:hypothetical protein
MIGLGLIALGAVAYYILARPSARPVPLEESA